jgi:hypothetical protein
MPLPETDALILLDGRPDKQALYNAGKLAEKICEEKKHCLKALLDISIGDSTTIYKSLIQSEDPSDLRETLGKMAFEISQSNIIDKENNAQVFLAGYSSGRKLKELEQQINEAAEALDLTPLKTAKSSEKMQETRRYYLKLKGPRNGCTPGKTGRIVNKPKQNFTASEIFNINRGGSSELLVLDSESLNSERNFSKIIKAICKHRKLILFSAIIGSVIYILFKKRKFIRHFINNIKGFIKPFYKTYRIVCNHWIFSNRITKSLFIFNRVVNRI